MSSAERQEAKGRINNQFLITGFSINPMEGEKGVGKWGSGERGAAGKKLWSHPIVDLNLGVQCR